MRITKFVSVKGGQGVTVTAAAYALVCAGRERVHLLASADTAAVLGLPDFEHGAIVEVTPGLTVGFTVPDGEIAHLVVDGDQHRADRTLLVTRPCFLALKHTQDAPIMAEVTGIVLVSEPDRALGAADAHSITGVNVLTEIPVDPAIARAVDAGLLAMRLPKVLRHALEPIIT